MTTAAIEYRANQRGRVQGVLLQLRAIVESTAAELAAGRISTRDARTFQDHLHTAEMQIAQSLAHIPVLIEEETTAPGGHNVGPFLAVANDPR